MQRNRRPIQTNIQTPTSSTGPTAGSVEAEFREALSSWAAGVGIVAATDGEEIDAITVSAVTSLSFDPPLILVAVGEHSSILPMLLEERRFTFSILTEEQQAIAGAVAQRLPGSEANFLDIADPAVRDALVVLDCSLSAEHPGGDHRIIVGRIERIRFGDERNPLLYFRRDYRRLR